MSWPWDRYEKCKYCFAEPGEPCKDRRWNDKHWWRSCKRNHPERRVSSDRRMK